VHWNGVQFDRNRTSFLWHQFWNAYWYGRGYVYWERI